MVLDQYPPIPSITINILIFKRSMKNRILFIGIGWEQEPLIEEVFKLDNSDVYAIHYNNSHKKYNYKDIFYCNLKNINEVLFFAEKIRPTAVLSDQDDYALSCQAVIASKYNLPGPSISNAQISANKFLQRNRCKERNIKHPNFELIYSIEQIYSFSKKNNYPIIIKPIDNRGSQGVVKINTDKEVNDAFYRSMKFSNSGLFIIEKFISGQEVTVDGYCFNEGPKSLAIASKGKINKELQVSFDIKYPAELNQALTKKIMRINEEVIGKLGYNFGMTHAEYIIDENEDIYLIEAANRGGGCFTSEIIVPNNSGIDLITRLIKDTMPFANISERKFKKKEVLLKFFNFKTGVVKNIKGLNVLKTSPHILAYRLPINIGDEIKTTSSDANRHGFIIVRSESNVRKISNNLMSQITIVYET